MGTTAIDVLYDLSNEEVLVLCHSYNGYLSDHGMELLKFFEDAKLINGIPETIEEKTHNGIYCCAASFVKHFKTEIGGVYLFPPKTRDVDESFIYQIYPTEQDLFTVYVNKRKYGKFEPSDCKLIMLESKIQMEDVNELRSIGW